MKRLKTVGIIGMGSFGAFAAACVAKHSSCTTIYGYDPHVTHAPGHMTMTDLATAASADIVILAIPLSVYPRLLPDVQVHIKPEALLVDVCSVKVRPEQHFAKYLPDHQNVLLTHPLFGPQSAASTIKGHTLIVTLQKGKKAAAAVAFCKQELGLEVHTMSSEEHDRRMAHVHALTSFIARGLSNLQLDAEPFPTPSYKMITGLVNFDRTHTEELFRTVQHGNPFAAGIRQRAVDSLSRLAKELQEQSGEHHHEPK